MRKQQVSTYIEAENHTKITNQKKTQENMKCKNCYKTNIRNMNNKKLPSI